MKKGQIHRTHNRKAGVKWAVLIMQWSITHYATTGLLRVYFVQQEKVVSVRGLCRVVVSGFSHSGQESTTTRFYRS